MIRVVVTGAAGKMGKEVCRAVTEDDQTELVGAVDPSPESGDFTELRALAGIDFFKDLDSFLLIDSADVLVDFTNAASVIENIEKATKKGIHVVTGTTGLGDKELAEIRAMAEKSGKNVMIAPNFAVGAVLMMKLSEIAASFAERAEIIELHHDQKIDAPSGTAKMTADLISAKMKQLPLKNEGDSKARGDRIGRIPVHSVRLPGLVAHQEVIFGFTGQTLTIRHDSIDRRSFMPGVLLAIKSINHIPGLTIGLDHILGF